MRVADHRYIEYCRDQQEGRVVTAEGFEEVSQDQRQGVYVETALSVVQKAYAAFRRQDIPALLELVGEDVDWDFIGPSILPYAGRRRNRQQMLDFFAAVERAEEFHAFEPREFIEAGEHVTVLGWLSAAARTAQKNMKANGFTCSLCVRKKLFTGADSPRRRRRKRNDQNGATLRAD